MHRRAIVRAALGAPLLAGCGPLLRGAERGPFAVIAPTALAHRGMLEPILEGARRVEAELKIRIRVNAEVIEERDALFAALREAARSDAKMVIGFGAAMSAPMQRVAWEFPEQRFSLIEGDAQALRPNLAIYDLLEPQAYWLAGATAALATRAGVVGIVADARDRSAAARDAFAAGVGEARANTPVIDAPPGASVAEAIAALADRRADIVWIASPVIDPSALVALRDRNVRAIGTGRDWTRIDPRLFIAAAVLDPGETLLAVLRDLDDAVWRGDIVRRFDIRSRPMRIAIADGAAATLQNAVLDYRDQVAAGRFAIPGLPPRTKPAIGG